MSRIKIIRSDEEPVERELYSQVFRYREAIQVVTDLGWFIRNRRPAYLHNQTTIAIERQDSSRWDELTFPQIQDLLKPLADCSEGKGFVVYLC